MKKQSLRELAWSRPWAAKCFPEFVLPRTWGTLAAISHRDHWSSFEPLNFMPGLLLSFLHRSTIAVIKHAKKCLIADIVVLRERAQVSPLRAPDTCEGQASA